MNPAPHRNQNVAGRPEILAAAIDCLADAIMIFDRNERIVGWNRAMVALTGLVSIQAVGLTAPELQGSAFLTANADAMPILQACTRDILAGGPAVEDDDGCMRDASGRLIDFSARLEPIVLNGEVVGVILAIRDKSARSSLLFRSSSVAMVHLDSAGMLREANQAFLQLVGIEEAGVPEHSIHDFVHTDDIDASRLAYAALVGGEIERHHAEQRIVRVDGVTVWVKVSIAMEHRIEAGPRFGVALLEDISERKQLELELRKVNEREAMSRLQFESAFDNAPVGVFLADRHGRLLKVNPALHQLLGYAPGALAGRRWGSLVHPADADVGIGSIELLAAGAQSVARFETRYVRADGGSVSLCVNVTLIRAGEGGHGHLLAHLEDVTHRRRQEQQAFEHAGDGAGRGQLAGPAAAS